MSQPILSNKNSKQSILGNEWLLTDFDENELNIIKTKQTLNELAAKILLNRGVDSSRIDEFLDITLKNNIPNPNLLQDMSVSVDRIMEAIIKNEKIGIIGDYDVDGIVSTSIIYKYLTIFDNTVIAKIPDRVNDGYGPNQKIIDKLKDRGVSLVITVDCGTNSNEIFKNNSDLDFIVIDHHQVSEVKDSSLIMVNPNRDDDRSGLGYLCAAGVVFLAVIAVNAKLRQKKYYIKNNINEPDILQYLPLVSMATIADIVPLIGLNRSFVVQGLKVIKKFPNIGLNAISEVANTNGDISYDDFGYVFGPRINAGGRIGHSEMGFILLTATDKDKAKELAERLDSLNTERKILEENSTNEAVKLYQDKFLYDKFIVLHSKWHPGIIGLIASRLTSRYNKPCFIISSDNGNLQTGSARSIYGVDVGLIINELIKADIINAGGGHEMAAGFKIKRDKIDELRAFLNLKTNSFDTDVKKNKFFDAVLMSSAVTSELLEEIYSIGPYGNSFEAPKFLFPEHKIKNLTMINNQHIRLNLVDKNNFYLTGISFRSVGTSLGKFLIEHSYRSLNFYGQLNINRWAGKMKPQLIIEDVELIE